MVEMGLGYGSECHLLRFLGRHRHQFNEAINTLLQRDGVTGIKDLDWFDVPYWSEPKMKDGEIKSLDFLKNYGDKEWRDYWPDRNPGKRNRKGVPSWDAVGILHFRNKIEWLLVEAKAHESEYRFSSKCCAGDRSLEKIKKALQDTYTNMGAPEELWQQVQGIWLGKEGYQVANRFACLNFFLNVAKPRQGARLLFVFFLNDMFKGKRCPKRAGQWEKLAKEKYRKMGIPLSHRFRHRTHYLFVDVNNGIYFFGKTL